MASDDWSGVPGVIGYRGDNVVATTGVDPQTVLADGSATPVDVNANQTNPAALLTGGIAEFELPDPVVALQPSGTASAPHLVLALDASVRSNITISYDLRDVDASGDNAIQPVALQYRVGGAGPYTNVPAGFVSDASTGPSQATLVTPVSATLPAAADGRALVEVRVLSTNAPGNDEWIGIDNIVVTGTDQTTATLVKDINPGTAASVGTYTADFTKVNGTLFFVANDGVHGNELWKSDGTDAGTVMVKDINPGSPASVNPSYSYLTNVNGTLFFQATDGTNGRELWKSDGTEAGTVMVKDIYPGGFPEPGMDGFSSGPEYLTEYNGVLFFSANDGNAPDKHGYELWKSDGTAAGTEVVKDINPAGNGIIGRPFFTVANGTLFFSANDGVHGNELWKSDGTGPGTEMVKDIWPGGSAGDPYYLTNVNGALFFNADDGTTGYELWKSDGTPEGTTMVKDIWPGSSPNSADPFNLTSVNGTLFFAATEPTNGYEVWKSDGTPAGTTILKDVYPGAEGSVDPSWVGTELVDVNGTLFFSARDSQWNLELWKSDGTAAGTSMVKDIIPGANGGADPLDLTDVDGTLYFMATDGTPVGHGWELWRSDGTEAGTALVKDIYPGTDSSVNPSYPESANLTNVNGTLFLSANDGTHGPELWRTDWPPVAVDDSKTLDEDAGATTVDVRANDTGPVGGTKEIVATDDTGAHGTVAITNSGADLTYAPDDNWNGSDSFTYTLNGGSTATVSVTVTPVDDPPNAADDTATVDEDSGASTIDVRANDTDIDGGPITIAATDDTGAHGTVAITNSGADLTYAPDDDWNGSDEFTYTLNGGSTATVSVTVNAVDDPPVAVGDTATVAEDSGANTIDVRANDTDIDGGPMQIVDKANGTHGTVAITNSGADLTYTPAANYIGADSFTYKLNGGSTATVAVTVTDATKPTASAPKQTLVKGAQLGTAKVPVRFAWTAQDNLTPAAQIKSTLQQRTRSAGATTWSGWFKVAGPTTQKTATPSLALGTIYRQFRAKVTDAAGNVGVGPVGPAFRAWSYQESNKAIAYSGTWTKATQAGALGGSVRYSTKAGSKATLTSTGRNLALVAPLTSTGGTAKVCLDPGKANQSCATVDLSPASGLGARKMVFTRNLSASATHKVQVTVLGGRVDVDAFVALR